jgi:hypothetical protein
VVEHTIAMINMFVQHYKAGTTLAKKFTAMLEALQIKIGCIGNPLLENYDDLNCLAMACWAKSFWERLHFYRFSIHMEYPTLTLPRWNNALITTIWLRAGYVGEELTSLNRCRRANKMLFLSDIATACGRYVDCKLLGPTTSRLGHRSSICFPQELPSSTDWLLWRTFWTAYLGAGGLLHIPLGEWLYTSHRIWEWFYNPLRDQLQHKRDDVCTVYDPVKTKRNMRHTQLYTMQYTDSLLAIGNPCSVRQLSATTFQRQETGTTLASPHVRESTFWKYLRSLGGAWMWEYIKEKEYDTEWLKNALINGTLVGVTDGSYDRHKAKSCSGSGWILVCTTSKKTLRGSFYEITAVAGAYRGELLGLVALHTLILALANYYNLQCVSGKICCDNISALNQASKTRKQVRSGIKHSDLQRAICTCKSKVTMALKYGHVRAHQDDLKPWSMLTLEEQLNVICNKLAKGAVLRHLSDITQEERGIQLMPLEKVAVVVKGEKLTTDAGQEVRYTLGHKMARKFFTKAIKMNGLSNTGGLGWSEYQFEQVAWKSIDEALRNKPDMFQIWHAKQCIGVCATRSRIAQIQDILDSKCPNCKQEQEKSHHLNRCPDQGRTLLFRESVTNLVNWMHEHNRTDAELAYWIEKYLIFRGTRTFTHLVRDQGSNQIRDAAASQDEIGWVEFLHGKVSVVIAKIQEIHCKMSDCRMTGDDWMKHFIGRLLLISHSQWLYCNFTLHNKTRGYLRLQHRKEVLKEKDQLLDTNPEDIPQESRYLLELDFTSLYNCSFKRQSYLVLAMKAARRAGRHAEI